MKVGDVCTRAVHVAYPSDPLVEAARNMCARHVGALVVVEPGDESRRPIGILTDRDVVRGQRARAADLFCLTVADVMTPRPMSVTVDLGLTECIQALNAKAVRRAPVLDRDGALVGIVTLDDLLLPVAEEMAALARLIGLQALREDHDRR